MSKYTFVDLNELVAGGKVNVVQVGAFWREARLAHPPSKEHVIIAVPVTLHLAGRLSAVVYAEMPVVAGKRVRGEQGASRSAWLRNPFQERRKAALLRFSVPDLELSWHGEEMDEPALGLARHFARVLAEEFPDAKEQLLKSFHLDMQSLIQHLSQLPFLHADPTQQDTST